MTRRAPYNDNAAQELSNVTRLSPVPVKTMRLNVDDADRTQFFAAGSLVERGKAVSARERMRQEYEQGMAAKAAAEAAAAAAVTAAAPPVAPQPIALDAPVIPMNSGIWRQFSEASFARKASAVLLPLLILLLVFKPVFKKPTQATALAPTAAALAAPTTAPIEPAAAAVRAPQLAASPAEPAPILPRGVSLEKAAVDAVAAGDFHRGVALYRELSRREPTRAAYADALAILERRVRAQAP